MADQSQTRDEFYRFVADDARKHIGSAILVMGASHWKRPMMLVADDLLAAQIDRDCLADLLATATRNAIACSVPLATATLNGQRTVRALRIELTPMPERSAILAVYPADASVDGLTQLSDLKSLRVYAEACRDALPQVPPPLPESTGVSSTETRSNNGMASSRSLPDRHSLRLFHRDLDVNQTAYRIANESRRMLGCDRVTVLTAKGKRWRVASVSGVAVVDRRSNAIRAIEAVVRSSVVMSRPLIVPSTDPLPPQIEGPIDDYLDQSDVQSAAILPLYAPDLDQPSEGIDAARIDPFHGHGVPIAVMVIENFSGKVMPTEGSSSQTLPSSPAPGSSTLPDSSTLIVPGPPGETSMINSTTTAVAGEAMLALRNSLEHQRVFALPIAKRIGNAIHGRRLPWILAGGILIAALVAAATMIRIEHYVVANGTVQPEQRREVFANLDGIIKEILVVDGTPVSAGDPLLRLENAELESQAESLTGKIQTTDQRLSSLRSLRLSDSVAADQVGRLAVEQRQLESELIDLRAQAAIVAGQQDALTITAPIGGVVSAWQVRRRLQDRPVSRGNALLTIVDPDGPWRLHLDVPDRDAGPVIESMNQLETLPVTFAVATEPERSYSARLETLSTAARLNPAGEQVLDGEAAIEIRQGDRFDGSVSRTGANVTAKIACRQRSVAASWFSDVVDFYHRHIAFHFR